MNPQLWLAPLHGITSRTFRNTLCRHFGGIDCFMSPFLPVQSAGKFRPKVWQDIAPEHNTALPLIPQLMGNKPEQFVDTVTVLHEQLATSISMSISGALLRRWCAIRGAAD